MSASAKSGRWAPKKVVLGLVISLMAVCGFDLLHTFLFPVVWPLVMVTVMAALPLLVVALVTILLSRKHPAWPFVAVTRRWSITVGLSLFAPIIVACIHSVTLMPLKFAYLTHRVESAASAEDEKNAFRLAAKWGYIWEVEYVDRQYLPDRYRGVEVERLLKIEWLESWPSGVPYQAYRQLIHDGNLRELERKVPANKPAAPNAGIASQLTIEHHWPGVGEPGRWTRRT